MYCLSRAVSRGRNRSGSRSSGTCLLVATTRSAIEASNLHAASIGARVGDFALNRVPKAASVAEFVEPVDDNSEENAQENETEGVGGLVAVGNEGVTLDAASVLGGGIEIVHALVVVILSTLFDAVDLQTIHVLVAIDSGSKCSFAR